MYTDARTTRDALHDGLHALAVTVALFGAPSKHLGLGALIGLVVGDFLAVVALFGAFPPLEDQSLVVFRIDYRASVELVG